MMVRHIETNGVYEVFDIKHSTVVTYFFVYFDGQWQWRLADEFKAL